MRAGETLHDTALRELREETGIARFRLLPGFEEAIRYTYRKAGAPVSKRVVFFLGESPTQEVTLSHEHHDYAWLDFSDAQARLTYRSARALLDKAEHASFNPFFDVLFRRDALSRIRH